MDNRHQIITFRREKSIVCMTFNTDLPFLNTGEASNRHFYWSFGTAVEAELVLRYLRERHEKAIQNIRESEFRSGWHHAKAKKHGLAYFVKEMSFSRLMKRAASFDWVRTY